MAAAASEAAARLEAAGFRAAAVTTEVPDPRSAGRATAGGHDLTVVGAGRHTWIGRTLLDSTSFHVLDNAPSSVLVAQGRAPPRSLQGPRGHRRIGGGRACGRRPGRMRRSRQVHTVTVISVAQVPMTALIPGSFGFFSAGPTTDLFALVVEEATRCAHATATALADRGLRSSGRVRPGARSSRRRGGWK